MTIGFKNLLFMVNGEYVKSTNLATNVKEKLSVEHFLNLESEPLDVTMWNHQI